MNSEHTEKLFKEIAGFIVDSRKLLEQGAIMEMKGFDDRVRALCDELLKLSPKEREFFSEGLQQLLDDLSDLGKVLAEQRDAIDEKHKQVNYRKASTAYSDTGQRNETAKKESDS